MSKPVYNAVQLLLTHKGFCTYQEVARVAGLKLDKTLSILNANRCYLQIKGGKIVGWEAWQEKMRRRAWDEGRLFDPSTEIPYNNTPTLAVKNPREEIEALREYVSYGLYLGDGVKVILDTPENRDKLKALGLQTSKEYLAQLGSTVENWSE